MNDFAMDRVGIDGVNGLADLKRGEDPLKSRASASTLTATRAVSMGTRFQKCERHASSEARGTATNTTTASSSRRRTKETEKHDTAARHRTNAYPTAEAVSKEAGGESSTIELLKGQGFSTGLAMALDTNSKHFDRRIWIVDNSGSMAYADGHRIVVTSDRKMVAQDVTRWEELQDTVTYHAEMATILQSPTVFTLLNHPGPGFDEQHVSVASSANRRVDSNNNWTNTKHDADDVRKARTFIQRVKPLGMTPLAGHLWKIQESVHALAPQLRRDGRRVAIVLATDGLPTDPDGYVGDDVDAEFLSALRSLEGLPVWVVIRLCTDESKVTKFYNDLDCKVDLSLEVLDDFLGEAEEVRRHNKWLNYGLPMHRCRELGYHNRVFDFLDERPLTKDELREFCSVLFGTSLETIPDPTLLWKEFLEYIQEKLGFEEEQFDPLTKTKGPWIYVKVLHRIYGRGKCTIA
jgi:Mg-chelatase subunit ChlD